MICPGIAESLGVKCSGRRNALGTIAGPRNCSWLSATSAILAKFTKSNSNVQTPHRLPLLECTHDPDCPTKKKCLSSKIRRRQFLVGQRAAKQMVGYFGGYISKKQKIGRFELKQNVAAMPFLHSKLSATQKQSPSSQLAHVTDRMFCNLEG